MFEIPSIVRRETKEANDIRREDGARPLAKWSWARLARRIDASHENLAALSRGGEGRRRPRRPASGGGKPTPDFLSSVASTAARVSRASFCTLLHSTRLESNPPSRFLDARSSMPWIPFRRGGSRDFERGGNAQL